MPRIDHRLITLAIIAALFVLTAGALQAEVPHRINYQGKLEDSTTGEPQAGTHNMTFRIYDDPSAGILLWSESQVLQADSAGIFSAILGSISPVEPQMVLLDQVADHRFPYLAAKAEPEEDPAVPGQRRM